MAFFQWRKIKGSGFTLVEALVVIAIIGILASLIIVTFNSAKARARDARRKSDLTGLSQGFEARRLNKVCNNTSEVGLYPGLGFANGSDKGWQNVQLLSSKSDSCGPYSTYFTTIPTDPLALKSTLIKSAKAQFDPPSPQPGDEDQNTCSSNEDGSVSGRGYLFNLSLDAQHYRLGALLETGQDSTKADRERLSADWHDTFKGAAYETSKICIATGLTPLNYFIGN